MKNIIKAELIQSYIKEKNLSKSEFCNLCKIDLTTLNKIFVNDIDFDIVVLFKIARLLKIEVCELFNE